MKSEICVLTDTFFLNDESCVLKFDGLTLKWKNKSISVYNFITVELIHFGDCCLQKSNFFFSRKRSKKCEDYNTILVRFAEPYKKNKLRLNNVKIRGEDEPLTDWFHFLRCSLERVQKNRPKKYLVLINPFSGRQNGVDIFMNKVQPLFRVANIDTTIVITKNRSDFGRVINCESDNCDAILAVGGDGTVSEIVNSLITNQMETMLPGMNEEEIVVPKVDIPIGIIPCGSTDCVAYTLNGTRDTETNALHAILGNRTHYDVCRATSETGENRFFISIFTFGYLTDLVKESEKFRWLGPMRYNYAGLLTLMRLKEYHSEVDIKITRSGKSLENIHRQYGNLSSASQETPPCTLYAGSEKELKDFTMESPTEINLNGAQWSGDSSGRDEPPQEKMNKEMQEVDKPNTDGKVNTKSIDSKSEVNCECNDCLSRRQSLREEDSKNDKRPAEGEVGFGNREVIERDGAKPREIMNSEESSNSITRLKRVITNPEEIPFSEEFCIKDRYFLIACANISCSSEIFPNGIAPDSFPDDGKMNVILFKPNTIWDIYKIFKKLASKDRKNIEELAFVSSYRTERVKIRVPQKDVQEKISGICDGELFPHSVVDIKIYKRVIQFYSRTQKYL